MRPVHATLLLAATLAHSAAVNPRQAAGGAQSIPATPPTKFSNGAPQLNAEPPQDTTTPVPGIYGARDIDLPFYRLYHGNMKFFSAGQLNTPNQDHDVWIDAGGVDNADQSACGIPDNAFFISKVAIHPYFLQYADLSRFCEQDVCISFWKEDGSSDMILKVTDICSTDPNDPTHCTTPMDIKIDRTKAHIMEKLTSTPTGDEYPEQIWWFFTKCWADALAQPAYTDNWFTTPALPNNLNWSQSTAMEQYQNNQKNYPAKGWPTYPNGGYNTTRVADTITDWVQGKEPCYKPIAGGKGWGTNICGAGQSSSSSSTSAAAQVQSNSASLAASSTASTQPPQGTGQGSGQGAGQGSGQGAGQGSGQGSNQGGSSSTHPASSSSSSSSSSSALSAQTGTQEPTVNNEEDQCEL